MKARGTARALSPSYFGTSGPSDAKRGGQTDLSASSASKAALVMWTSSISSVDMGLMPPAPEDPPPTSGRSPAEPT